MTDTCPACGNDRDNPKHYTSRCAGDWGCYCEDAFHNARTDSDTPVSHLHESVMSDLITREDAFHAESSDNHPTTDPAESDATSTIDDLAALSEAATPVQNDLILLLEQSVRLWHEELCNTDKVSRHGDVVVPMKVLCDAVEVFDALHDEAERYFESGCKAQRDVTRFQIAGLEAEREEANALQAKRDEAVKMAKWLAAELGKVAYDDNETKVAACYRWLTTAREAVRGDDR